MAHKTMTINGVNFSLLRGAKAEDLVNTYKYAEHNGYTSLRHVYGTYSWRKEQAFEDCDEIRRKLGGYTMYISGACSNFFSLVYLLRHEGKEYIVKETYANRFIAEVPFGALR